MEVFSGVCSAGEGSVSVSNSGCLSWASLIIFSCIFTKNIIEFNLFYQKYQGQSVALPTNLERKWEILYL